MTQVDKKKRRSTFAVIFYINKAKVKKNGLTPLMGRISIDAEHAQFSAKIDVDPKVWDAKAYRATGKSKLSRDVNKQIEIRIKDINNYYVEIVDSQGYVTAELIKNALTGIGRKKELYLELFAEHNEEFKLRVGVDRAKRTNDSYILTYRHLSEFIKIKYNTNDVTLRSLNHSFIDAFDYYLRVEKKMVSSSVLGHIIYIRKIIQRAINQGIICKDPFVDYTYEPAEKKCNHLTIDELEKILSVIIDIPQVCQVRDMFIFSCYTGLAYVDMCNLSEKHIKIEADGSVWISIKRQKTGGGSNIRLLDISLQIIEKYKSERKNDNIFNMYSSGCISYYLRTLEKLTGINWNA